MKASMILSASDRVMPRRPFTKVHLNNPASSRYTVSRRQPLEPNQSEVEVPACSWVLKCL